MRKTIAGILVAGVLFSPLPASAHKVKRVTIKSICHYEENYYVWTAGESWKVWGRVKPAHGNKKVVLQKSKLGNTWKAWKRERTRPDGRYRFKGTAPTAHGWHLLLRVKFVGVPGHKGRISQPIYVDTNPAAGC